MASPRPSTALTAPDIPGPDPEPRPPGFAMPAGAWDTHFHVIDRATGLVPERSYTPPDAPLERLRALHDALGVARGVFVQVSVHGTDNRAMLAALRATPGYRGVAVVDETITDAELAAMHAAGVRGIRVNLLFGGGVGFAVGAALAPRIASLGWHIQLLIDVSAPDVPWDELARWPVPLVIDHMGHMPVARGAADPGFARMLGLLRDGKAWVKLSGAERISANRAPPFDDVVAHAQTLIEAGPDRCVWGSDWPHVMLPGAMPNDGHLLDQTRGMGAGRGATAEDPRGQSGAAVWRVRWLGRHKTGIVTPDLFRGPSGMRRPFPASAMDPGTSLRSGRGDRQGAYALAFAPSASAASAARSVFLAIFSIVERGKSSTSRTSAGTLKSASLSRHAASTWSA